jgi:hypothetical protein
MDQEAIYLSQTIASLNKKHGIFKIGRTSSIQGDNTHLKDTILHFQLSCFDAVSVERAVLTWFEKKYNRATQYGSQYFHGVRREMIQDIITIMAISQDEAIKQLTQKFENLQQQHRDLQKQLEQVKKMKCSGLPDLPDLLDDSADDSHEHVRME